MRSFSLPASRVRVAVARPDQRVAILQICADIYAADESSTSSSTPWDLAPVLDQQSIYLIATRGLEVLGFIGITPPTSPRYALETYLSREQVPIQLDEGAYELRLLTVARAHQRSRLAALLMYGAFRWVVAHGGTRIVAVSRRDKLTLFRHVGLRPIMPVGRTDADLVLLSATVAEMQQVQEPLRGFIERLEETVTWDLGLPG